ncbi:MAG: tetratricopeptide repeat protein [Bacteroidota bacterium]
MADSINYVKGKGEGLRTLGFCTIRLSKHDEALPLLNEAEKIFVLLGDEAGRSDILEYYGIINRGKGDYANSLDNLYKSLELRQQENYEEGISLAFYHLGVTYRYMGNLEQALDLFLKNLTYAQRIANWVSESYTLNNIGSIYFELDDYRNALKYFQQSLIIRKKAGDKWGEAGCLDNIGLTYFKIKEHEKATEYCLQGLEISKEINDKKGEGNCLFHLGEIYKEVKDYNKTVRYCKESLEIRRQTSDRKGEAEILLFLAELSLLENYYREYPMNPFDLLDIALKSGEEIRSVDLLSKIHRGFYKVAKHFDRHQEALEHIEQNIALEREMHSASMQQKILNLEIEHSIEFSKKETEIYRLRNIELAGLYDETNKQKEEIDIQKQKIEKAFAELKEAQTQLIQSEKMASLGELTAGIAHEIQNPLNFVNNFSDINKELLEEMKEEMDKGNLADAKEIANDILENEGKINHHGKRADAIVKGMLQHSQRSSGKKESTDINALCDEYVRLAYHGLRAKDKTFNSVFKTDFDPSIVKVNIIPRDIGRVLLNLYNNAFYAVNEKKKQQPEGYEPFVFVSTRKNTGKVEIKVSDNGNGIPQKILDKIFQPFFTTKPTGQGTGLGLSLSYDIVKAHNGEIKVETIEGEATVFTITLSIL